MKSNQLRYGLKRVFDMRKIKFRGKSKRSEGWLFGYLFEYGLMSPSNVPCICAIADISWRDCYDLYEVEPDTVGQCTRQVCTPREIKHDFESKEKMWKSFIQFMEEKL